MGSAPRLRKRRPHRGSEPEPQLYSAPRGSKSSRSRVGASTSRPIDGMGGKAFFGECLEEFARSGPLGGSLLRDVSANLLVLLSWMGPGKVQISTCTCSRPAPRKEQHSTTYGVAWHTIAAPNATGIWTRPGRARVCPTYDRCLLFAPFSTNVSANSLLFVRAACYVCLCSAGSQHADHHVYVAPAGARDVATLRVAGVSSGPGFHGMSQRIR